MPRRARAKAKRLAIAAETPTTPAKAATRLRAQPPPPAPPPPTPKPRPIRLRNNKGEPKPNTAGNPSYDKWRQSHIGQGTAAGASRARGSRPSSFKDLYTSGQLSELIGEPQSTAMMLSGSSAPSTGFWNADPRVHSSGLYPDGAQFPAIPLVVTTEVHVVRDGTYDAGVLNIYAGCLKSSILNSATMTDQDNVATWATAKDVNGFASIDGYGGSGQFVAYRCTSAILELACVQPLTAAGGTITVNGYYYQTGGTFPTSRTAITPIKRQMLVRDGTFFYFLPIDILQRVFYPTNNVSDTLKTYNSVQIYVRDTGLAAGTTVLTGRLIQRIECHPKINQLTARSVLPTPTVDLPALEAINEGLSIVGEHNITNPFGQYDDLVGEINSVAASTLRQTMVDEARSLVHQGTRQVMHSALHEVSRWIMSFMGGPVFGKQISKAFMVQSLRGGSKAFFSRQLALLHCKDWMQKQASVFVQCGVDFRFVATPTGLFVELQPLPLPRYMTDYEAVAYSLSRMSPLHNCHQWMGERHIKAGDTYNPADNRILVDEDYVSVAPESGKIDE